MQGVIFDADGTLLESMHVWQTLGNRYLKSKNIEPDDRLEKILAPMSMEESSLYLKKKYILSDSTEKIAADTIKLLEKFYAEEVRLKNGVYEYLKMLDESNIPMSIATSNNGKLLKSAFKRLKIDGFFKGIVTCTEVGASKKSAEVYRAAARLTGTKAEETTVFEDSLEGINTAKGAGFKTIAVADFSNADKEALLKNTADGFIADFTELIKIR